MKHILPPLAALLLCIGGLWGWTNGFTAFTVFSHTLAEAGPPPRAFPNIPLINQDSTVFRIKDKHKYVLLNFVYLNCPNVCHKVNNRLEGIYTALDGTLVPGTLELVTVSFDLRNDDVRKLKNYRKLFVGGLPGWTFALPHGSDEQAFGSYLKQAGVWAYRLPESGIINHSVYLFLLSPANELVRVFDPAREDDDAIIAGIRACVNADGIAAAH